MHPHISLQDLIDYCQLCHEYRNKVKRVSLDTATLKRVREVARIETKETIFLGIQFSVKQ